jgi:hypothetical protein
MLVCCKVRVHTVGVAEAGEWALGLHLLRLETPPHIDVPYFDRGRSLWSSCT